MVKVNCEACGAPYEVDPRRIPQSGLKMRCPGCGASFHVQPLRPELSEASLDLDLPAPKRRADPSARDATQLGLGAKPSGATSLPEDLANDLAELPAPKRPSLARDQASPARDHGSSFDLDLPALKATHDKPFSAPKARAELADDLDLPAPKAGANDAGFRPKRPLRALAPEPQATAPQPAAEPACAEPAPAQPADFDLDLPAPRRAPAQPQAGLDVDLPTPARKQREVVAGPAEELELDLPAPRKNTAAAGAGRQPPAPAKRNFAKPVRSLPPDKGTAASFEAGVPKDSLAIDPGPLYAGLKGKGTLGDLDEIGGAIDAARRAQDTGHEDLPAVRKRPSRAGTELGLGMLPRDSLDLPPRFTPGASDTDEPALGGLDLPAPSDLPRVKGAPARQAAVDLPAPLDLPRAKPQPTPDNDSDLPAPANLPKPKDPTWEERTAAGGKKYGPAGATRLGLGGPAAAKARAESDASTELGIGAMLESSLNTTSAVEHHTGAAELDFGHGQQPARDFDFSLDLPPVGRAQVSNPDASAPLDFGKLSLPEAPAAGASPLHSTMALGAEDLELDGDRMSHGALPLPSMGDPSATRSRAGAPTNATIELDGLLDFGGLPPDRGAATAPAASFGELDFGLGEAMPPEPAPMPQPIPVGEGHAGGFDTSAVEAELLGGAARLPGAESDKPRKKKREGGRVPAWAWPLLLVVTLAGTGMWLGLFTNHGYFGVYLLEQLLPEAGDPVHVAEAIARAEGVAKADTYRGVRKALVILSDARNEAGLSRPLLVRSLLHESLYQLRFGEDAQSAQRAAAILSRIMERDQSAEGLTLARAADAARRGALAETDALLAQVPPGDDPYRDLVIGEIALRKGAPAEAKAAFERAKAHGGGARASWGLVRALVASGDAKGAEQHARDTLEQSPTHAGALIHLAERAVANGELDAALSLARKAVGAEKVGAERTRPSRADRARGWTLMGRLEETRERPREAHRAYEQALTADPLRVSALIGSGRTLMRLGRARDALSRFDSALNAKPATTPAEDGKIPLVEAGVGAVQALLAQDRAGEALQRAAKLVAQFKDNEDVVLWHGHALEAAKRWDEAETAFQRVITMSPGNFTGYVALSQLLFRRNRPEEGARILAEASGKVKDSADVRRMLGYSELNRSHLPEAIHHFERALSMNASDAGALLGLTTALRKSGRLDKAEQTLKRLEAVDPLYSGLPLERGQLLETRGDYAGAVVSYRKALEQRPDDTDLKLRLGAALVTAERLDEADVILQQVLKERPTSAEAEHFVGRVLLGRGDTAQAVQHLERAVALDAQKPEYHMFLGWALLEQNNLGSALESVNAALERDPNLGDGRWILGRIQLRAGAVKDALKNFELALKLKPGRVEALADRGDAYDGLRQLNAAIQSYQEAVKARPNNGAWWYRLGMLHLEQGSRDESRVALSEAVLRGDRLFEKPTWLADAHRLYAEVLRDAGRTGEAIEHYRSFLELAPAGHPERDEIARIVRSGVR